MSVLKKALSKWESRKMQMWFILFVASTTIFIVKGDVTFKEWSDFQIWAGGIFVGGNAVEYVSGAMTPSATAKTVTQPVAQPTAQTETSEPEV